MWKEGDGMIRVAEQLVAAAPKLRTRGVAGDWAPDDPAVRRAVAARDLRQLDLALLAAMTTRLPLLARTRAALFLLWVVTRSPEPVPVSTLEKLAKRVRIGWRTLERVKPELGITAIRQGGEWYWHRRP